LQLIITDGCPGLAGAIQTVYPRVLHQRCWVHKMRNIREKGRVRDRDELKQRPRLFTRRPIANKRGCVPLFQTALANSVSHHGEAVREGSTAVVSVFSFPKHLWKQLRTTNLIECCFVEVRQQTRPMVCLVNLKSVDRIIYSIFHRFNLEWKTRTLEVFTQAA
jgi:transposase-like protein